MQKRLRGGAFGQLASLISWRSEVRILLPKQKTGDVEESFFVVLWVSGSSPDFEDSPTVRTLDA